MADNDNSTHSPSDEIVELAYDMLRRKDGLLQDQHVTRGEEQRVQERLRAIETEICSVEYLIGTLLELYGDLPQIVKERFGAREKS